MKSPMFIVEVDYKASASPIPFFTFELGEENETTVHGMKAAVENFTNGKTDIYCVNVYKRIPNTNGVYYALSHRFYNKKWCKISATDHGYHSTAIKRNSVDCFETVELDTVPGYAVKETATEYVFVPVEQQPAPAVIEKEVEQQPAPAVIEKEVEQQPARSCWEKGVKQYAVEFLAVYSDRVDYEGRTAANLKEFKEWILNGANDYNARRGDEIADFAVYSAGGCALIYDRDIANRLCTPSELVKNEYGCKAPNLRETWIDVQTRALWQAWCILRRVWHKLGFEV